jgi:hypothetical protein
MYYTCVYSTCVCVWAYEVLLIRKCLIWNLFNSKISANPFFVDSGMRVSTPGLTAILPFPFTYLETLLGVIGSRPPWPQVTRKLTTPSSTVIFENFEGLPLPLKGQWSKIWTIPVEYCSPRTFQKSKKYGLPKALFLTPRCNWQQGVDFLII